MVKKISKGVLTAVLILTAISLAIVAGYVLIIFTGGLISNYIHDVPDEAMPREWYLICAAISLIVAFIPGFVSWRLLLVSRRRLSGFHA